MNRRISSTGIERLSLYYRYLSSLIRSEEKFISSEELGDATDQTADQVRRDVTCFGSFGVPSKGYRINELKDALGEVLGKEKIWKIAIVGVGNLGSALLAYKGFKSRNFNIVAAFDNDIRKIGKNWENVEIKDIEELNSTVASTGIEIAIVSVPVSEAQNVVDKLVSAGVKAILNFAPVNVNVPEGVKLQNVDLSIELDRLCYWLKNQDKE
jgi:redox-sensing transcriptional repressor